MTPGQKRRLEDAVAKGEHRPSVVFDLRAGLLATARLTHADYDGVPCVLDHLFRLEAEIVERFRPLSNEFADLRRTVCGLNLWKRAHVIPLDVLLRHRPRTSADPGSGRKPLAGPAVPKRKGTSEQVQAGAFAPTVLSAVARRHPRPLQGVAQQSDRELGADNGEADAPHGKSVAAKHGAAPCRMAFPALRSRGKCRGGKAPLLVQSGSSRLLRQPPGFEAVLRSYWCRYLLFTDLPVSMPHEVSGPADDP
jgi:hypothetical protein